jgi:hypothetical protein
MSTEELLRAIFTEPEHHPTYMVARGRCWVHCACGWKSDPNINGNQNWAKLQFAEHRSDSFRKATGAR